MAMVDSKLAKSVSKSVGRAKEKILQNLGKVDRTADEIFDEHVGNFNKQQYSATRLQKELNNYIRCIRATAAANRSLLEAVGEVYEPEWGGRELLTVNSQNIEILFNDFAQRLAEQVLIPINSYQGQFPDMRKKIEKRGRKLVDFDGERHALQALQSNPRRAEAKLNKQRENLEAAKHTYEVLNSELHEELPALYSSRIVFLVSALSTLFTSETIFHNETSKVFTELEGLVDRLAKESAKGNLNNYKSSNAILNSSETPKEAEFIKGCSPSAKMTKSLSSASPSASGSEAGSNNNNGGTPTPHEETNGGKMMGKLTNGGGMNGGSGSGGGKMVDSSEEETNSIESSSKSINDKGGSGSGGGGAPIHGILHRENGDASEHHSNGNQHVHIEEGGNNANTLTAEGQDGQDGQKTDKGILYRVRATYRYQKEDVDELSFEAGELISVVEFEDAEDQEEGWLMGKKENGEKGLFPANFTRPI